MIGTEERPVIKAAAPALTTEILCELGDSLLMRAPPSRINDLYGLGSDVSPRRISLVAIDDDAARRDRRRRYEGSKGESAMLPTNDGFDRRLLMLVRKTKPFTVPSRRRRRRARPSTATAASSFLARKLVICERTQDSDQP